MDRVLSDAGEDDLAQLAEGRLQDARTDSTLRRFMQSFAEWIDGFRPRAD